MEGNKLTSSRIRALGKQDSKPGLKCVQMSKNLYSFKKNFFF